MAAGFDFSEGVYIVFTTARNQIGRATVSANIPIWKINRKPMAIVAIVYHSGFGHTKLQAEAVHRGAGSVAGVEARLYTSEEGISKLDELDQADAIIFGCPTYMGNISAEMKKLIGSFVGAMSASFQVQPPDAPPPGDIATAQAYGERVAGITLRLAK